MTRFTAGHIAVAQAAQKRFHLDAIYFVPSSRPPHKTKPALTPFVHRYAMVALACADHAGFRAVARRSARRTAPRRTSSTRSTPSAASTASIPTIILYFIVGADQFLEIPTWKNYEALLDSCDFIIASRPGFRLEALRLVIPPEKLGRAPSHDPHKIVLRKSTIHLLTPSRATSPPPKFASGSPQPSDNPRACARARGGIHSGTGLVPVTLNSLRPEIRWAVEAAQDKQAVDVTVLKLSGAGAFAEYFLLCSGTSQPQIQAIGEAIEERLRRQGFASPIAKENPARNGCCSITAISSCTFSASARGSITISSGCGAAPSAIEFPAPTRPPESHSDSELGSRDKKARDVELLDDETVKMIL